MKVRDIMTSDPATCAKETSLEEAARLMVAHDCGAIPVLDAEGAPIGIVTDRDITCRAVAKGRPPLELRVADCMTEGGVTVTAETSVQNCCALMEEAQIRRILVVDAQGRCIGIVALADIAEFGAEETGELVEAVSHPTDQPSGPAH